MRQMEAAGDVLEAEWGDSGAGSEGQGVWEGPGAWDHRAIYPFTRTVGGGFRV